MDENRNTGRSKSLLRKIVRLGRNKNNEKSLGGAIGEWIYTPYGREEKKSPFEREQHNINVTSEQIGNMISIDSHTDSLTESLTPNAMQRYWRTPTEFPLCPSEVGDRPLTTYLNNLKKVLS